MAARGTAAKKRPPAEDALDGAFVSREEGVAMFDREARRLMGMSGEEFLRKWDAGDFDVDGPDHTKLIELYFLMPFVR
ncbi:MAG: hypothetical protein ACRDHF_17065 [Tepidiformaceae bacterium]